MYKTAPVQTQTACCGAQGQIQKEWLAGKGWGGEEGSRCQKHRGGNTKSAEVQGTKGVELRLETVERWGMERGSLVKHRVGFRGRDLAENGFECFPSVTGGHSLRCLS